MTTINCPKFRLTTTYRFSENACVQTNTFYENSLKSKSDIQYRKNPLTWLNGKCWNDEITESPANNQILTQKSIEEFDWDNVGLGSVLPNGAIITPDVVHIHESTGLSYRKLSSL
jgi:hypothetical protein